MALNRNYFEIQSIENLTTEFPLYKELTEAVEINHRHVSVEAPKKTCAIGQLVNVAGHLCFQNQRQKFVASGRVADEVELTESISLYTIEMHRYDLNLWADFRHAIEKNQREVDRLFRSMRDSDV